MELWHHVMSLSYYYLTHDFGGNLYTLTSSLCLFPIKETITRRSWATVICFYSRSFYEEGIRPRMQTHYSPYHSFLSDAARYVCVALWKPALLEKSCFHGGGDQVVPLPWDHRLPADIWTLVDSCPISQDDKSPQENKTPNDINDNKTLQSEGFFVRSLLGMPATF